MEQEKAKQISELYKKLDDVKREYENLKKSDGVFHIELNQIGTGRNHNVFPYNKSKKINDAILSYLREVYRQYIQELEEEIEKL